MQRTQPSAAASIEFSAENGIVERLEQVRRIIEDRFVAAGDILLNSLDGTGELISSLDTLVNAFDARIVATTKADLTLAAAKLCTLPACHAKHVETVARLTRSRETLARHISVMRCSLAFMAEYTRHAELVTDTAVGTSFARNACKISECIAETSHELHALEDELAQLKLGLSGAATQGEILGRKIAALLPAVPDELSAAARVMAEHYRAVAATAEQVSVIARNIRTHVTRILAALQFGDITRQRIEHIQACLIKAEADAAVQPRQIRRRFKATCYALIAKHLSEIDADFDREIAEIEQTTAAMAVDTVELLRLHDIAFDCDGGRGRGFLHTLTARIDAAIALVATIEAVDKAATETGRATIETLRALSGRIDRVQSLRDDMLRITQRFAASDDDLPLNIITVEIRTQLGLIEDAARVSLAALDTLLRLTSAIAGTGKGEQPQDSRAVAAAAALAVAAQRIRQARDITETDIVHVVAKGDALVDILALSSARLCLRQEIGAILSLAASDAARRAEGAFQIRSDLPDALIRTLADIGSHNTMARERNIHQAFVDSLAITFADADRALANETDPILF